MKEKFLPVGTVVLLKGGQKELMITGYCIFPKGKGIGEDGQKIPEFKIYEYAGCLYPEGVINSDTALAFNHAQIEKICHMGYETDIQKELSEQMSANFDKFVENLDQKLKESQS